MAMFIKNQLFSNFTRLCVISLLSVFLLGNQVSFAKSKYIKIKMKMEDGGTISDVFNTFVKDGVEVTDKFPMSKKTKRINKNISDWGNIEPGTSVKVIINKKYLDRKKLKAYKRSVKRNKRKKRRRKKRKNKKKETNFALFTNVGTLTITDDNSNTLSMNLLKFGASYTNKLGSGYKYNIGFASVTFTQLEYSRADEPADYGGFLPEMSLGLTKSFGGAFSLGFGYDYLNYFVLNEISDTKFDFTPEVVHRINVKPYYALGSFGILGSTGIIAGAASGFDASLGIAYNTQVVLPISLAVVQYYSSLDVESRKETSSATVLSFALKF